ncbi:MAG: DUF1015 domain-containing protein [Flavobacteriales bacterium]|nr:DUF1015 domain-containing protein [Flavobacteriales bacterium]
MAKILPFKGYRPKKEIANEVVSRSLDAYTNVEIEDIIENSPNSFIQVVRPEKAHQNKVEPRSIEYNEYVKSKFEDFLEQGIYVQDEEASFYIYEQEKFGRTFTGLLGCASIDDYLEGVTKKHEQTLTFKQEKLKEYYDTTNINAEPVCFAYKADEQLGAFIAERKQDDADFNFSDHDGTKHKLWVVSDETGVNVIITRFDTMTNLYIADGHHRSASLVMLGQSRRKAMDRMNVPSSKYMGVFFSDDQLEIFDFNRTVVDLGEYTPEQLVAAISGNFDIENKGPEIHKPTGLHNISMFLDGNWYSLTAKDKILTDSDPLRVLDCFLLSEYLLGPVMDIKDLKVNNRIDFIDGTQGMEALQAAVENKDAKVAFGLYPVTPEQLFNLADNNQIMPPKSTWVEPKLCMGMTVYKIM